MRHLSRREIWLPLFLIPRLGIPRIKPKNSPPPISPFSGKLKTLLKKGGSNYVYIPLYTKKLFCYLSKILWLVQPFPVANLFPKFPMFSKFSDFRQPKLVPKKFLKKLKIQKNLSQILGSDNSIQKSKKSKNCSPKVRQCLKIQCANAPFSFDTQVFSNGLNTSNSL